MCATLSGDTAVLRLLAEHRANMNHSLDGMSDLGDSPFSGFQLLRFRMPDIGIFFTKEGEE